MAALITAQNCFVPRPKEEEEEIERIYKGYRDKMATLPKYRGWSTLHLCQYQGFWFQPKIGLEGVMWVQQRFKPRPTDVYLATNPKSGTTWLKAIVFSIMNRKRYNNFTTDHPLLKFSPHEVVPFMELDLFRTTPIADPEILPSPRILATHIAYNMLPESIQNSSCPIVYICRNPKDVFVSFWQFSVKMRPKDLPELSFEEAFDLFCHGVTPCGPFWDQALGYWKASVEFPNRVLFLKYEDMKTEPLLCTKRIAEFLGQPFSLQEEENGIVQEIVKLCSFESMSNLEVNRNGKSRVRAEVKNDVFFRQGKVGDWKNHLTDEMIERLDQITNHKFDGTGLIVDTWIDHHTSDY